MSKGALTNKANFLRIRQGIISDGYWPVQRSSVVQSRRAPLAPPAASGSSPAAATTHSISPSIPRIPDKVQKTLNAAHSSWFDRCLNAPLVDPATNSRVHVYGTVHFAPFGGSDGILNLQELLDRIQPTVLAIEQPYDLGAQAGLPYPEVLHQLAGLFPNDVPLFAGPRINSSEEDLQSGVQQQQQYGLAADVAATAAARMAEREAQLRALLPGLAQPAQIGRDLLDPFEVLGMYGGCDYVTFPAQSLKALTLFGHLPGLEYAALVVAAQQRGVQVRSQNKAICSVDAPLRLQEKWVRQLVADFTLSESDLTRRLQQDLDRLMALLPAEYLAWDMTLADAVRQVERQRAQIRDAGTGGGGARVDDRDAAEEPALGTVTAFKVSKAVAAATVSYEASREAFAMQAALQPLKFALFARRAKHLVLQVRDLCQRMSMRQVRVDADKFKSTVPSTGHANQTSGVRGGMFGARQRKGQDEAAAGEDVALVDVSEQPVKVVLAVVGRQYIPYIEELWANERSFLWHGDVRRTFARSMLERG
ncbi:hypothetical protein VaNZ11_004287 [Volvox africanus]|uniref:Uncharacterized protein n=1 Tax=Volvox africanus TaxID=51714 RepID=A0ABQ5RVY4_9CHLO|nr:hypothetical protein VaNZ11_004287 [Volvox africanus]